MGAIGRSEPANGSNAPPVSENRALLSDSVTCLIRHEIQPETCEISYETRTEFLTRIDADISPKLSLGISAQPALVQAVSKLNVPFIFRLNLTLKS